MPAFLAFVIREKGEAIVAETFQQYDPHRRFRVASGGGEAPAFSLVDKGYLTVDGARESFALTPKAKDFLAYDPKPEFEEEGGAGDSEESAE